MATPEPAPDRNQPMFSSPVGMVLRPTDRRRVSPGRAPGCLIDYDKREGRDRELFNVAFDGPRVWAGVAW